MIFHAEVFATPDYYHPRLRATVPGCWRVQFADPIPGHGNIAPEFVGATRRAAIENAIACLKARGLTGRLRLS